MTSKEMVLSEYPDAYVVWSETGYLIRATWRGVKFAAITERFETEEAAWQNAAESLPAQPEQIVVSLGRTRDHEGGLLSATEKERSDSAHKYLDDAWIREMASREDGCLVSAAGLVAYLEPVAPVEAKEKCGKRAGALNPRLGLYFSCVLDKGHDGDCAKGGTCFKHGAYVGEKCPQWPNCVAEPKPTPSTPERCKHGIICPHECKECIWEPQTLSSIGDGVIRLSQDGWKSSAAIHCGDLWELLHKPQPDSSSIPEIELELRRMMWLGHGHTGMYGDDGEMQCMECRPFGVVDYKREPLDKVRETFRAVQMERMMKPRDSSSISTEPDVVERIAVYMESESECLMPIVVEETKHDYGVRLLKVMADEIRHKMWAKGQSNGR